jgi:hypothetical protein
MFKTALKSLVFAVIYTAIFFAVVNFFYWRYNMHQTMFHNIHYYAWVQYAEGAGGMFILSFIFEMIRNSLGKK